MCTKIAFPKPVFFLTLLSAALLGLGGCAGVESEAKYPTGADRASTEDIYSEPESIFGKGGLKLMSAEDAEEDEASGIGVNSYLWRASLDTISFMPLASADPFGGVILTDWYAAPETPDERIKMNVYILDRQLRADGIQVKVFKQKRTGNQWTEAAVAEETGRQIEDAILTRARQLRVARMQK